MVNFSSGVWEVDVSGGFNCTCQVSFLYLAAGT